MRRRHALKVVRELDAFPKVSEDYQKSTGRGGLFSVVAITIIIFLIISEFFYFKDSHIRYEYSVDTDMESRIRLVFDVTVAMPCEHLGADVIDAAGESRTLVQQIHKEPVVFDLTEKQRKWLDAKQAMQKLVTSTAPRTLRDLPTVNSVVHDPIPPRQNEDGAPHHDSCRLHGFIELNKVAGNFHITAGQAVPHIQGHAHINAFVPSHLVNFSHRIDRFTFGESAPWIIDPLEGTHVVTSDHSHIYQYYLQIVPTFVKTKFQTFTSNQYSVTERNRHINHTAGSHGLPGVFFKYDIYSLMVSIKEERNSFIMFLVKLCALVGGVFVTLGMISQFIGYLQSQLIHGNKTDST